MRKAQKEYLNTQILENHSNGKKIWEIVNEFINRKQKQKEEIEEIIVDNNKITDAYQIAESFNNFFSTIGSSLAKKMQDTDINTDLPKQKPERMQFQEVTANQVKK